MRSDKTATIDYRLTQKLTNKILNTPSVKKKRGGKRRTKKVTDNFFFHIGVMVCDNTAHFYIFLKHKTTSR